MNSQDKLKRLKELNKIAFPSNEELQERLTLLDELELSFDSNEDRSQNIKYEQGSSSVNIESSLQNKSKEIFKEVMEENKQNVKPTKVYRGIISGRIEKWRDERRERNKATPEMIEQLKLEMQKTRLEAQIEVMKKIKKENKSSKLNFHFPKKIFVDDEPTQNKKTKSQKSSHYRKIEDSLRDSLGTNEKDFSSIITTNKKDFKI